MSKTPERSELNLRDTWKLEDMYASNEAWEAEYAAANEQIAALAAYEGKLGDLAMLKEALDTYFSLSRKVEGLFTYARMRRDEDNRKGEYQALCDRAQTLMVAAETAGSYATPELLAQPEEYLTAAVYGYILRHGLYGTCADMKALTAEELRCVALSYLKPRRMPHVLGTAETAVQLARRYGADEEEARVAALLHDCTKKLSIEEQLALCEKYGVSLDPLQRSALKLQHAITGAEIARDVFGVNDTVYEAIRWHTTGKADMTTLEKVIYLADYIEPTRDFPGVEELRQVVWQDLDRGMLLGLEMTVEEMAAWGNPVHEDTLRARDFLAEQLR